MLEPERAVRGESLPLQIVVDSHVVLDPAAAPRSLLDALRRQIRHRGGAAATDAEGAQGVPGLLGTRGGRPALPQALLPLVLETCRRQQIAYAVEDRRAVVPCPWLRAGGQLSPGDAEALRQLLLRDAGVVTGAGERGMALASELISRRQQRCLVLTPTPELARRWRDHLGRVFDLAAPDLSSLQAQAPGSRVVVGTYREALLQPGDQLQQRYGMQVFDRPERSDPSLLWQVLRRAGARYLLGLAQDAWPEGEMHRALLLALGGVLQQLDQDQRPLIPRFRRVATGFDFPYEGRHQYQALLKALALDEARAQRVAADVAAEAGAGHPCLVLSDRREQLEAIYRHLPRELNAARLTSAVRPAERDREVGRLQSGASRVLLATHPLAAEQLRAPRVSRLFLPYPVSYERKVGQAFAWLTTPSPGQQDAVLYDYDDPRVDPLHRAFEKRSKILDRLRRRLQDQRHTEDQLDLPL